MVPDGKMFRMTSHAFRMTSHERAIYRAGSLTLSLDSISACHVSNPERVIQHKVLWPEVPLDIIDAPIQPNHIKKCHIQTCKSLDIHSVYMRVTLWRGVTLHGNNPFRV